MKSRAVALAASLGLLAAGCTPPWAKQNSSPFVMEIASLSPAGEDNGSGPGSTMRSDVLTGGGVFNDDVRVAVNVFRKNNNPTLAVSPVEHVYLVRYEVRFFRTDGRNVEGVDVPYSFSGPLGNLRFHTASPGGDGEVELSVVVTVVRHQAKVEPPLINLRATGGGETAVVGGAVILTTIAEITVYGQTVQGESLIAKGQMHVTFADFADQN